MYLSKIFKSGQNSIMLTPHHRQTGKRLDKISLMQKVGTKNGIPLYESAKYVNGGIDRGAVYPRLFESCYISLACCFCAVTFGQDDP
jgi:hypothetical protein